MAEKGWTAQLAAAAGVAAGTGAAQLGLGYGLGVVAWPATITDDDSVWLGSLGWATWIAASATVFGAVIASRLASRPGGPWRFALAVSAAIGAVVTVALIALPARASVRVDTFAPQTIAAGYAVVGILFGLVIAYWAVGSRPVAANLIATAAWLWALAVAAIVVDLIWHRPTATYLSSWQFASSGIGARYGTIYWPSSALTLLAALLLGVIAAWPAVRRGDLGVGAASSGAVGPLLVAAAFFALAPRLTGALGPLESAYLIAPYAVLAGLAGSAVTVAIGRRAAERRARRATRLPRRAGIPAQAGTPAQAGRPARQGSPSPQGNPTSSDPSTRGRRFGRRRPPEATGVAAVPAPRSAAAEQGRPGRSVAAPSDEKHAPTAETSDARTPAAGPPGRPRIMGRLRRTATTASDPASAAPGEPPAPDDQATGPASARKRSDATRPAAPRPATGRAAPANPAAPKAATPKPMQPPPVAPDPVQPPPTAPAPVSPARSTVAPPPAAPPVAKINQPRPESRPAKPAPRKKITRPPAKDE
jgi:hypothetical protein